MSIIVDKLNYFYEDGAKSRQVLKDISVVLPKGQFVAVIGHTGSGKSTFIQHLNGILKAGSGSVYYDGQDIYQPDYNLKELRSKVGLVFQYPEHQLFETDVFKDVCFGPKNIGMDEKKAQLRAFEALKQVGISEDLFYVSPFELSGGQKRRVAIAGVLAMKPEVLILDEPTAGLDPKGRDDLLNMLKKLHEKENMTIILVSHSMEDVAKYAQRVVVMEQGRIVFDDVPKEVFAHKEELEEMRLGIPEVACLMQELKKNGFKVDEKAITIEEAKKTILQLFKER